MSEIESFPRKVLLSAQSASPRVTMDFDLVTLTRGDDSSHQEDCNFKDDISMVAENTISKSSFKSRFPPE